MDKLLAEHFYDKEFPGPNLTTNIGVEKFQSPTVLITQWFYVYFIYDHNVAETNNYLFLCDHFVLYSP